MFNKIIILLLNFNRSRLIKISLLILLGSILEILAFGSIIPLTLVLVDNNSINDIDAKQLEEAAKKMGGGMPNGLPGLGGGLPLGLSGFGKKK